MALSFQSLPETAQSQILRLAIYRRVTLSVRFAPTTSIEVHNNYEQGLQILLRRFRAVTITKPAPMTALLTIEQVALTILRPLAGTCRSLLRMILEPIIHSIQFELRRTRSIPAAARVVYNTSRDAHVILEPENILDLPTVRLLWPLGTDRPDTETA